MKISLFFLQISGSSVKPSLICSMFEILKKNFIFQPNFLKLLEPPEKSPTRRPIDKRLPGQATLVFRFPQTPDLASLLSGAEGFSNRIYFRKGFKSSGSYIHGHRGDRGDDPPWPPQGAGWVLTPSRGVKIFST